MNKFAWWPKRLTEIDGQTHWGWLVFYWHNNGVNYHCRMCDRAERWWENPLPAVTELDQ